jgi:hypothetical protein
MKGSLTFLGRGGMWALNQAPTVTTLAGRIVGDYCYCLCVFPWHRKVHTWQEWKSWFFCWLPLCHSWRSWGPQNSIAGQWSKSYCFIWPLQVLVKWGHWDPHPLPHFHYHVWLE